MKFRYVVPTIEYKDKAIDYINEFYKYGSNINGSGRLDSYLDDYEGWLKYREECRNAPVTDEIVPGEQYFFVNENDEIIGLGNIRFKLNDRLKKCGGHIGYSIRPSQRGNGYNKINLYLALKVLQKIGVKEAMLTADVDNPASWRTMEALGGKCIELFENEDGEMEKKYIIEVDKSLEENKDKYEQFLI